MQMNHNSCIELPASKRHNNAAAYLHFRSHFWRQGIGESSSQRQGQYDISVLWHSEDKGTKKNSQINILRFIFYKTSFSCSRNLIPNHMFFAHSCIFNCTYMNIQLHIHVCAKKMTCYVEWNGLRYGAKRRVETAILSG